MKHSIHRSLLCLMAVISASLSACSWHTDVYDEFNGNKGFFKCSGYCDLSLMNVEDGQTIDESSCVAAAAQWNPMTLTASDGTTINSGYCSITTKEQCESLYKHYANTDTIPSDLWTEQNAMDLGDGRYIVRYRDAYYCGSFDALFSLNGKLDTTTLATSCTADEQDKLDNALKGGFCPKDKQECIRFTVSTENITDKTTDSQNVALCSGCPTGQAVCMDFVTAKMGCVDIMSDENHCGSCMTRCSSNEKCVQGFCIAMSNVTCSNDDGTETTIFPNAENTCGATCENRNGKKCGDNARCLTNSDGVTYDCSCNESNMTRCDDGQIVNCIAPYLFDSCGVTCNDVLQTTEKKCSYGEKCNATGSDQYECQCDQELLRCSEGCIDPNTHGLHCGAKGNCTNEGTGNSAGEICTNGMTCQGGECKCPEGKVKCNGQCLDPLYPHTCGATDGTSECEGTDCGAKACEFNETSNNYQCECDGVICDSNCIDPKTSSTYCGAKGNCQTEEENGDTCTGNQVCNNGICDTTCAADTQQCEFETDKYECVSKDRHLNSNCKNCDINYCPDKSYAKDDIIHLNCTESLGDINNCGGCFYPFGETQSGIGKITRGYKCQGDGATCDEGQCACENDKILCTLTTDERIFTGSITEFDELGSHRFACIAKENTHIKQPNNTKICTATTGYKDCNQMWEDGFETDVATDINNCGFCGNVCNGSIPDNSDYICRNGSCSFKCNKGFNDCNNKCVDIKSDNNNCGKCQNKCSANSTCQNGSCVCDTNTTLCNHSCVNTNEDKNNCGRCGLKCDGNCVNGQCQGSITVVCEENTYNCNYNDNDGCETTYEDLMTDKNNCGSCHNQCSEQWPNQSACQSGKCCDSTGNIIYSPDDIRLSCCDGYKKCKKYHNSQFVSYCAKDCNTSID